MLLFLFRSVRFAFGLRHFFSLVFFWFFRFASSVLFVTLASSGRVFGVFIPFRFGLGRFSFIGFAFCLFHSGRLARLLRVKLDSGERFAGWFLGGLGMVGLENLNIANRFFTAWRSL